MWFFIRIVVLSVLVCTITSLFSDDTFWLHCEFYFISFRPGTRDSEIENYRLGIGKRVWKRLETLEPLCEGLQYEIPYNVSTAWPARSYMLNFEWNFTQRLPTQVCRVRSIFRCQAIGHTVWVTCSNIYSNRDASKAIIRVWLDLLPVTGVSRYVKPHRVDTLTDHN